jgi:hypothetical protein
MLQNKLKSSYPASVIPNIFQDLKQAKDAETSSARLTMTLILLTQFLEDRSRRPKDR